MLNWHVSAACVYYCLWLTNRYLFIALLSVLDVHAFERLLGPCMDIMKRNFNHYEDQLVKLFGSKSNVADLR